jgi:hypothetical protein
VSANDPYSATGPVPAGDFLPPDSAFPAEVATGPEVLVNVPGEGLLGWLRKTVGVLRRGWRQQVALFALTHVTSGLVLYGLLAVVMLLLLRTDLAQASLTDVRASYLFFFLVYGTLIALLLIVLPFRLVGYGAATWVTVRQAAGLPAPLGRAVSYATRRLPAMMAWQTLAYALVGAAVLMMLLTCLNMFAWFGFVPSAIVLGYGMMIVGMLGPAVLFERRKPLLRAFDLVNNAFWASAVRLAVPGAALVFAYWANQAIDAGAVLAVLGDTIDAQVALIAGSLALSAAFELPLAMLLFPTVLVTYAERRAVDMPTLRTGHLLAELG